MQLPAGICFTGVDDDRCLTFRATGTDFEASYRAMTAFLKPMGVTMHGTQAIHADDGRGHVGTWSRLNVCITIDPDVVFTKTTDTEEYHYQCALEVVASRLAYNTSQHVLAMKDIPALFDNTQEVKAVNLEVARTLGIGELYEDRLQLLTQDT